jgi:hypothetical protein
VQVDASPTVLSRGGSPYVSDVVFLTSCVQIRCFFEPSSAGLSAPRAETYLATYIAAKLAYGAVHASTWASSSCAVSAFRWNGASLLAEGVRGAWRLLARLTWFTLSFAAAQARMSWPQSCRSPPGSLPRDRCRAAAPCIDSRLAGLRPAFVSRPPGKRRRLNWSLLSAFAWDAATNAHAAARKVPPSPNRKVVAGMRVPSSRALRPLFPAVPLIHRAPASRPPRHPPPSPAPTGCAGSPRVVAPSAPLAGHGLGCRCASPLAAAHWQANTLTVAARARRRST